MSRKHCNIRRMRPHRKAVARLFRWQSGDSSGFAKKNALTVLGPCFGSLVVATLAFGGVPTLNAEHHAIVVGRGVVQGHRWRVEAVGDGHRRGICLEVAVAEGIRGRSESQNAQCSAPALHRGIVRVVVKRRRSGNIVLTAVGMAFNRRVATVEVALTSGRSEMVHLRRVRSSAGGQQLRHFKFAAFAVRGAWCVREMVTRNADGGTLWAASFKELIPYDPVRVCP